MWVSTRRFSVILLYLTKPNDFLTVRTLHLLWIINFLYKLFMYRKIILVSRRSVFWSVRSVWPAARILPTPPYIGAELRPGESTRVQPNWVQPLCRVAWGEFREPVTSTHTTHASFILWSRSPEMLDTVSLNSKLVIIFLRKVNEHCAIFSIVLAYYSPSKTTSTDYFRLECFFPRIMFPLRIMFNSFAIRKLTRREEKFQPLDLQRPAKHFRIP